MRRTRYLPKISTRMIECDLSTLFLKKREMETAIEASIGTFHPSNQFEVAGENYTVCLGDYI